MNCLVWPGPQMGVFEVAKSAEASLEVAQKI